MVAMITTVQSVGLLIGALKHVHVYIRICILVEPGLRQSMGDINDNNYTEHWPFARRFIHVHVYISICILVAPGL